MPAVLRVDNGPEFLSQAVTKWCPTHNVKLQTIQADKPNQNAYIECLNRINRNEVLNLYLFSSLQQVREITSRWMDTCKKWPHDALGGLTPSAYVAQQTETPTLNCLPDGKLAIPLSKMY